MTETTLLSEHDVRSLTTMREAIEVVETNFREAAKGRVVNPSKLRMALGEDGGWPGKNAVIVSMPAYVGWVDTAGVKLINGFWDNVGTKLPTMSGLIALVDMDTGAFQAVLEGAYLTGLRTGAQAAVGTKYLAKSSTREVSIFGAGVQGKNCARAVDAAMSADVIRVFDPVPEARAAFTEEMEAEIETPLEAVGEAEAAADADVIITVTTANDPFLEADWLRDGVTIAALGTNQEVADDIVRGTDRIVVDHIEQSLHAGNLHPFVERGELSADDIHATIGEVIVGQCSGRETEDERVLYVPFGLAAHDIVIGKHVYEAAIEEGTPETFAFV